MSDLCQTPLVNSDDCDFDLTDDELRAARTVKWAVAPEPQIAAWVAELDVRPCPVVLEAVQDAVSRGTFGYSPFDSLTGLPHATASFQATRFGWDVDADLVVGCGDVMSGVGLALDYLCEPGPVIVPVPAYPPMLGILPLSGRSAVPVPFTHRGDSPACLDLEAINHALAQGARTVLLTAPHNPLGRVFTPQELLALRDVVNTHGARVISDEIHAPLVLPGATHTPYASLPDTAHHTTTVTAASKAWNIPGLKCAQVIAGNAADAAVLRSLPYIANHGTSPLGVAATLAAYRDGGPWLDNVLAHLDRQRTLLDELMATHLPHLPYTRIEATYLVWIDVRPSAAPDPVLAARAAGIEISAGADFGAGFEGFARLNIGTSAERLERIVAALGAAWS